MATLPLFDPAAAPGYWHAVKSPGGYECWTLDAVDPGRNTQILVMFAEGLPQHEEYLRRYAAYVHRPTGVAPPLPADYAGVLVCLWRDGELLHRSMTRGRLTASREKLAVQCESAQMTAEHLRIGEVNVDLSLNGHTGATPPRSMLAFAPRSRHDWSLVAPRLTVTGTIGLPGQPPIPFSGAATIDHAFGTSPAAHGVARFIRGRVFLAHEALAFNVITPAVRRPVEEVALVHASAGGIREIAVKKVDYDGAHVRRLAFDDHLALSNPRLLEMHDLGVRMTYDAAFAGQTGLAYCDVIYPRQPKLPMLASLVEWSIPFA